MFLVFYSRRRSPRCNGSSVGEGSPKHLCLQKQLLHCRTVFCTTLCSFCYESVCISLTLPYVNLRFSKLAWKKLSKLLFIGSISEQLILLRSNFQRNITNVDIRCHYSLWRPVGIFLALGWAFIFIFVKDDDDSTTVTVFCKWIFGGIDWGCR